MTPIPILLFSLPRSGSTLLQRILAAHPEIGTTPEPWILLPMAFSLKSQGVYAEYDHGVAATAIAEFAERLPGGLDRYYAEIGEFATRLYGGAVDPKQYFVDKTPRYSLIIDEIVRIFPNAKYVMLFRNPLAIVASMIERWGHANRFRPDLYLGLRKLIAARSTLAENCLIIKYEDLVLDTERETRRLCEYLEVDYSPQMSQSFSEVELTGRYGDNKMQGGITSEPLERWKTVLRVNPLRHMLARRYLDWIGKEALISMGYSYQELLSDLGRPQMSVRHAFPDLLKWLRGWAVSLIEPEILADKIRMLPDWHLLYPHR